MVSKTNRSLRPVIGKTIAMQKKPDKPCSHGLSGQKYLYFFDYQDAFFTPGIFPSRAI